MASVKIDSGEFKLMRNIDIHHQPSRAAVYEQWTKAFNYAVPEAINNLADVIEDVYKYKLWEDKYLPGPKEFFERVGIFNLNLDDPARLIKELKDDPSKAEKILMRNLEETALISQGYSRQQRADILGVHRSTLWRDGCKKPVITEKMQHKPRKVIGYRITQYTKPETAAMRLREVFGDEWVSRLAHEIIDFEEFCM